MGRYRGTISASPDPVRFGEVATFTVESDCPQKLWGEVKVYGPEGTLLMGAYPRFWAGEYTVNMGPTPSWQSGSGLAVAKLMFWDGRRFRDIAETEFEVIP